MIMMSTLISWFSVANIPALIFLTIGIAWYIAILSFIPLQLYLDAVTAAQRFANQRLGDPNPNGMQD
jgi:hypothetical protein